MRSVIMRSLVPAVFILVLLAWGISAQAVIVPDTYWQHDPATPGDWNDPLNWTVRVPVEGDFAVIDNGGTAIITGDGAALILTIGYNHEGASHKCGYIVQDAGTVTISGMMEIVDSPAPGGYTLNGGQLYGAKEYVSHTNVAFTQNGGVHTVSDLLTISAKGTYILNGGQLSALGELVGDTDYGYFIQNGPSDNSCTNLMIGGAGGSYGIYTQNGGTTTVFDELGVGAGVGGGEYNLKDGLLFATSEHIGTLTAFGAVRGTFKQVGGTHVVSGGMQVNDGEFDLKGGELSAQYEYIGRGQGAAHGLGTFMQSGATNTISEYLNIGYDSSISGTYVLDSGELTVGTDECVGCNGSGTFTQNGGMHVVSGKVSIGLCTGRGYYYLAGGTLETKDLVVWNSGTLEVANDPPTLIVHGNLFFGLYAIYNAGPGATVHFMNGLAFSNQSQTSEYVAGLAETAFLYDGMAPLSLATFEVAGCDFGKTMEGFDVNFAVMGMTLGQYDDTYVRLVDKRNNGNRGGEAGNAEALYLRHLTIYAGSTLDLNGYHLYVEDYRYQMGSAVVNGEIEAWSTTEIGIPEPGTIFMVATAVVGMAAARLRRMKHES
jgi:hypothetical protein